jgi:hypothetical protein
LWEKAGLLVYAFYFDVKIHVFLKISKANDLLFLILANMFIGFQAPLKKIEIDGNCRVEDRGLKSHHGDVICL